MAQYKANCPWGKPKVTNSKGINLNSNLSATAYFFKEPLTIRVLFCYSRQTLHFYKNKEQLLADNDDLCFTLAGILNHNLPNFQCTVTHVGSFLMEQMQGWRYFMRKVDIQNLLKNYIAGEYPNITNLKTEYKANLVVFIPMVAEAIYYGLAGALNFKTPQEACLALARGARLQNKKTATFFPTLFAHELGHLLGCLHPLHHNKKPDPAIVPAYGHHVLNKRRDIINGTLMSTFPYEIWYYSNPNLCRYPHPNQNLPCGTLGVAEAYKVIAKNLPRLANSL